MNSERLWYEVYFEELIHNGGLQFFSENCYNYYFTTFTVKYVILSCAHHCRQFKDRISQRQRDITDTEE